MDAKTFEELADIQDKLAALIEKKRKIKNENIDKLEKQEESDDA